MNIVIPMAGLGSRFKFTHKEPKPLIDVDGQPMVKAVIETLRPKREHRFIFIVNKKMDKDHGLSGKLKKWTESPIIIQVERETEGALCSVLSATKHINNDNPMMISNCDQIIEFDINDYYRFSESSGADGTILTYKSKEPFHSFAKIKNGFVTETAEKIVISDHATVGLYWFKKGRDFVNAAAEKVGRNDREPNGEFYNCPVYNQFIANGGKVIIYEVDKKYVYTIGTPETLRRYLDHKR